MVTGKVKYGFLANEVYFATEGTFDFATQQWGPQNLRIVSGRVASVGFSVAGDVGVKEVKDLKGKRLCNPNGPHKVLKALRTSFLLFF